MSRKVGSGTGAEGSGLAFRWAHAGLPVVIGSRDAARAVDAAAQLNGLLGRAAVDACHENILARVDDAGRPDAQSRMEALSALDLVLDVDRKVFSPDPIPKDLHLLDEPGHLHYCEAILCCMSGHTVLGHIVEYTMSDGGAYQLRFIDHEERQCPRTAGYDDAGGYRVPTPVLALFDQVLTSAVVTRAQGGSIDDALLLAGQAGARLAHLASPILVEAFREYVGRPEYRTNLIRMYGPA